MKKRLLSIVLVLIMCLSLVPKGAYAATITVSTEAELLNAFSSAVSGDTIRLGDDIAFSEALRSYMMQITARESTNTTKIFIHPVKRQ